MIEKVVNVKVVDNVQATTQNVGNLKTQLRQAQNEVNELSAKFGATSEQAVEAAKRAAQLKDAIGDAKALTDAFNPDAKFKALTSTLGGVAGGFAAVQGAVGLLGEESQSVEKAILKVQSAMAISQGVQAIGESVDSFRQLGAVIKSTTIFQKALSAATAVQTFVTNGATLAAKLLRGALISTGIGALVVGVGMLIANFDKVKKVVMTLIPGLSAVGDVVMSIVNTVTDFIGVTSEAERETERLVNKSKESLARNKRFMDEHGDQIDEYTKRKIEANDKYNQAVADGETNLVELRKRADREIAQADKDRQAEKDKKAKEEQDKIDAKNKEARDKRKQDAIDRAKKDAEDLANAKKQQLENTKALENEITQAIGDAQDKNAEMFMSAQDAEERAINDKYFRLKELAIQQGKDIKDIEIQQMNEINDVRLTYQAKEKEQADKKKKEDIAREQEVADAKRNINDLAIQSAQNVVSILAGLGEKNKKIQKVALVANGALSIAEIINNTNVGSSKEVATKGVFGLTTSAVLYAKMALSIGSVIAATAKGLSALGGGGSVGGGSSSNGGGATQATAPQFNIVGQSQTNQLAQTIAGKQQQPIEAFVVSSAVTNSQSLDRNRVKTATFGS